MITEVDDMEADDTEPCPLYVGRTVLLTPSGGSISGLHEVDPEESSIAWQAVDTTAEVDDMGELKDTDIS